MLSFNIDTSKGETPASVARKRAIVQALMASQRAPQNIGEGLNALGDGIVENVLNRRADAAETAGQSQASDAFGGLINAGTFPAAPGGGALPSAAASPDGALPSVDVSKTIHGGVDPASIYSGLKARGLNDAQAYATLGNWKQESEFRPGAINPGEGAVGFTQWREGRKTSLENFARATGRSASDPEAQMDFYVREAGIVPDKTGTVVVDPGGSAFAKATDIQGANRALKGFIRYGSPYDKGGEGTRLANALAYQKRFGSAAPGDGSVAAAPADAPVQVASNDPSDMASVMADFNQRHANGEKNFTEPGAPMAAPGGVPQLPNQMQAPTARPTYPAAPLPNPGPGDPAATTPAGERVLSTMMSPTPISGQGAVVQALSAANPPAQAPAAPSPVVQALAGAMQPEQAAPASPGVQQVAHAMQSGKPQGPGTPGEIRKGSDGKNYQYAQTTGMAGATGDQGWIETSMPATSGGGDLPVMAGGSSDAIQPGQAGPSVQQLMQAAADPWLSPEHKAVASMMLQQRMQDADPLRQLHIQAARKSLVVPPKQWQKLDDHTLFDAASGETKSIGSGSAIGDIFDGKSVEGQSLNWLIQNGKLTPEQAAQIGAGKTITGPNGELIFMTPQGVFGQAAGGQAQPITPTPQSSPQASVPAPAAPIAAPAAPAPVAPAATPPQPTQTRPGMIPLTDPKSLKKPPNEAQQRNQQLYTVVKPEVERIDQTFGAMSDPSNQLWSNLPVGADYATTQEYQQAANSLRTVVASYLYSVSGATATPGEVENLSSTLIPKVGEAKGSIDDKLARIHTMVEAIKNNRGDVQDEAPSAGGADDLKKKYGLD